RAADDVRQHAHALSELDVRQHVRQGVAESRRLVLVRHRERVDRSLAAGAEPLGAIGKATGADGTRVIAHRTAVAAALHVQLVPPARFPEALRFLVDAGDGLRVFRLLAHIIVWSAVAQPPLWGGWGTGEETDSTPPYHPPQSGGSAAALQITSPISSSHRCGGGSACRRCRDTTRSRIPALAAGRIRRAIA